MELIRQPIEAEGFDLIELKLVRYKSSTRVRVFVDSDNGVKLDDCAHLSRIIETALDAAGVLRNDYMLEVSSPGLDRPLQTNKDFRRRVGESVRIFFDDAGRSPMEGELVGADETSIELLIDNAREKIDLAGIRMGKILF